MSYTKRTCVDCGLRKSQPYMKKVTRTKNSGTSLGVYNIRGSKVKFSARSHFSHREQWVCIDCNLTENQIVDQYIAEEKRKEEVAAETRRESERRAKIINLQRDADKFVAAHPALIENYEGRLFSNKKINAEIGYKKGDETSHLKYLVLSIFPITFFLGLHKSTSNSWSWYYPFILLFNLLPSPTFFVVWLTILAFDLIRVDSIVTKMNSEKERIYRNQYIYISETKWTPQKKTLKK